MRIAFPVLLISLLAVLLGACTGNDNSAAAATARLKTESCRVFGIDIALECAILQVPEDRAAPAGRMIGIQVAILRAKSDRKQPDPIFIFAGGPGQSAVEIAPLTLGAMSRLNRDRDLVFVDQRGTGDSNGLFCDFGDTGMNLEAWDPQQAIEFFQGCLSEVRQHADPTKYTTTIAMQDIDAVRAALGYTQINLWGASYGTRAALEYIRRYPANVRSAVLDGMAPFGMRLPYSFLADGNAALQSLLTSCNTTPDCRAAYPTLEADLRKLLKEAATRPRRVDIPHPRTGERTRVDVTPAAILGGIRAAMYNASLTSVVPASVKAAVAGDFAPLLALALAVGGPIQDQISLGMHMSVVCSEDWPLVEAARRAHVQTAGDFYGGEMLEDHERMCAVWPRGTVPKDYYEPVKSDVPVLLLSGGIDPATPPRHAAQVLQGLSRGKHLVAPNLGHGVSLQGCAPDLIKRFYEAGNADKLDDTCLKRIPKPVFFKPLVGSAS